MTPEQLAEIEARWAKWINPKSAPKTLGGDFLILLAEVRRLNQLLEMRCVNCHLKKESEVGRQWLKTKMLSICSKAFCVAIGAIILIATRLKVC